MTRVLIIEDIAETRQWLVGIAAEAFGSCVTEEAGSVRDGIAGARRGRADVALIDLTLPDGSGLEVLDVLRQVSPQTLTVVTTVSGDDASIAAALAAGSNGYLLKEQPEDFLVQQLKLLAAGIPVLSPSVARRIMDHFRLTVTAAPETDLTPREKQVLALIARGLRNVDVARELQLAESTVATHIKSIYYKLGISTRAEASWQATKLGLRRET